jgi:hypothetical protein
MPSMAMGVPKQSTNKTPAADSLSSQVNSVSNQNIASDEAIAAIGNRAINAADADNPNARAGRAIA